MTTTFNRVIWDALSTRQIRHSIGGDRARRFDPEKNVFAATRDDTPESMAELAALLTPGGEDAVCLAQADEIVIPGELIVELSADVVALAKATPGKAVKQDVEIHELTASDHGDMLALAELTEPGPFRKRTPEIGNFWGVRIDGRLAAMAGERFSFPGHTEISAVCTHPDYQGRGLASALSAHAARQIEARGDRPMLHAYATNTGAIKLYQSLGFELVAELNMVKVARPAA